MLVSRALAPCDVGFEAEHDRAHLIVVTELSAAHEAARRQACRSSRGACRGRVIGNGDPRIAGVDAAIHAAPIEGYGRQARS